MVVLGQEPMMFECRVFYIGSAPPVETLKGLDAVQEPLRKRYPENLQEVEGADAMLCVLPTVLEMRYIDSGEVVQWPLDRLSICAGVRAVNVVDGSTGKQVRQFVPVNTVQQESEHPAIFSAIIRRNKGRQIAECHMFICRSTRDALHLVNAAATANMSFRKQHGRKVETTTQGNDVIVIKSGVANGYSDGDHASTVNYESQTYRQPDFETVRVENNESSLDTKHFQIQQSTVTSPEPETIYITFDKSNLKPKGDGNMEVTHTVRETRRSEEYARPRYAEVPAPAPVPVFRPMYMGGPPPRPSYTIRHMAPPPPQPMMVQRPVLVRSPPPPPMMIRQPHYTKRVMAPPPQPRFISQPPIVMRSRARSASPIGRYSSEVRAPRKGTYQPKWGGISRPKSDVAAPRMSRRDMYDYLPPPPPPNVEFFQQAGSPRPMHLNERAFSRRMHADHRITRDHHQGYHYPTAYDLHSAMLYDRPTTKSNPRYSSSSSGSSDEGGRNRFKSSRR